MDPQIARWQFSISPCFFVCFIPSFLPSRSCFSSRIIRLPSLAVLRSFFSSCSLSTFTSKLALHISFHTHTLTTPLLLSPVFQNAYRRSSGVSKSSRPALILWLRHTMITLTSTCTTFFFFGAVHRDMRFREMRVCFCIVPLVCFPQMIHRPDSKVKHRRKLPHVLDQRETIDQRRLKELEEFSRPAISSDLSCFFLPPFPNAESASTRKPFECR